MKAIILAAGQGTRIRSAHGACPKCLIRFDNSGWTILDQHYRKPIMDRMQGAVEAMHKRLNVVETKRKAG